MQDINSGIIPQLKSECCVLQILDLPLKLATLSFLELQALRMYVYMAKSMQDYDHYVLG